MATITIQQVQELFDGEVTEIDRGDHYPVITRDDLDALLQSGGIDTSDLDDHGRPVDGLWEVLADSLTIGDPDADVAELDDIVEARNAKEDAKNKFDSATEEFNETIRAAVRRRKASMEDIAEAAGLSVSRLYQIRDGRR